MLCIFLVKESTTITQNPAAICLPTSAVHESDGSYKTVLNFLISQHIQHIDASEFC